MCVRERTCKKIFKYHNLFVDFTNTSVIALLQIFVKLMYWILMVIDCAHFASTSMRNILLRLD